MDEDAPVLPFGAAPGGTWWFSKKLLQGVKNERTKGTRKRKPPTWESVFGKARATDKPRNGLKINPQRKQPRRVGG